MPHIFILVYSTETEKTWFVEKSCVNASGAPWRNCNQLPISKQLALTLFSNPNVWLVDLSFYLTQKVRVYLFRWIAWRNWPKIQILGPKSFVQNFLKIGISIQKIDNDTLPAFFNYLFLLKKKSIIRIYNQEFLRFDQDRLFTLSTL